VLNANHHCAQCANNIAMVDFPVRKQCSHNVMNFYNLQTKWDILNALSAGLSSKEGMDATL
jgi:hypothetical protein